MKQLAIVVGGWHFPALFYRQLAALKMPDGWRASRFCIAHRWPDGDEVRTEKIAILRQAEQSDPLVRMDCELYSEIASVSLLGDLGFHLRQQPNTIGDWMFLNQWAENEPWWSYDAVLFAHDDTQLLGADLAVDALSREGWLAIGNSSYPQAPVGYLRGSLECFSAELLQMVNGRLPLGVTTLDRRGQTDTPYGTGLDALADWNAVTEGLRRLIVSREMENRIHYLSEYYRISRHAIEGERGFLHWRGGAPWSFEAGLKAYGDRLLHVHSESVGQPVDAEDREPAGSLRLLYG